jgi:hypothetical protein
MTESIQGVSGDSSGPAPTEHDRPVSDAEALLTLGSLLTVHVLWFTTRRRDRRRRRHS